MPSTERDEAEEIVGDGPQKTQQRKEEKASDDLPFAFRNEIGLEKLIEGYGERIGTELAVLTPIELMVIGKTFHTGVIVDTDAEVNIAMETVTLPCSDGCDSIQLETDDRVRGRATKRVKTGSVYTGGHQLVVANSIAAEIDDTCTCIALKSPK